MNDNEISNIDWTALQTASNFTVMPYDISSMTPSQYTELELSKSQKSQLSMIQSSFPDAVENTVAINSYIAKFPDGLPHTMIKLKQGGVGSTVVNSNGKFAGSASLYSTQSLGVICSCFSLVSFATGQYYLENLHNDLNLINQKIDKILGFLYGEKSAELLAEISFVNDAYKNFDTNMQNEYQRIATITNLQESKKIAMKDIEFYINDLTKTVMTPAKNYPDFENIVTDSLKIKDSLKMATQLYTMSNILEVYYSENFDPKYIEYIKESISTYIDKCDNRILTEFSHLNGRNSEFRSGPLKKIDTSTLEESLSKVINNYSEIKNSKDRKSIRSTLDSINIPVEYVITKDNRVFFKKDN